MEREGEKERERERGEREEREKGSVLGRNKKERADALLQES